MAHFVQPYDTTEDLMIAMQGLQPDLTISEVSWGETGDLWGSVQIESLMEEADWEVTDIFIYVFIELLNK